MQGNHDAEISKAVQGFVKEAESRRQRNFNPVMSTAAKVTIAEVEEIVEVGALDPEAVVTPAIFVDRVVRGEHYDKRWIDE